MPKESVYWKFVKYYQRTQNANGFNLTRDMANQEAAKVWSEMSQSEKELFRAQQEDTAQPRAPKKKENSIVRRERIKTGNIQSDFIRGIEDFRTFVFSMVFIRGHNGYWPREITIVRFSVEGGIKDYFHVLTRPDVDGDTYTKLRRSVGLKEHVVRIAHTPNSVENQTALTNAMLQFCTGKVLLVPCRNRTEAKLALQWSRLSGIYGYVDAFDLLVAEEVLQKLSQRTRGSRLTEMQMTEAVARYMHDDRMEHLRCGLHQELRDHECSLKMGLGAAYALVNCLSDTLKVDKQPITHQWVHGERPDGTHYHGNGIDEEDSVQTCW